MQTDVTALKAAHRLEEIVSERVQLVPDGNNLLKGLCPFHTERTPSFFVYVEQQTFHCFGASCLAHGDIITYLQRLHGWDFRATIAYLRDRVPAKTPLQPPPSRASGTTDIQLAALRVAVDIYHRDITSRWSPQARMWLAGRGLLPEKSTRIIDLARLGYCTGARGPDIIGELHRQGIPITAAREIGILGREGTFEPFRGRLIIPEIRDGVVVWMTGRLVDEAPPTPDRPKPRKYQNVRGPRRLLGMDRITGQHQGILVESPLDWLTLVLWGYPACAMDGGTIPQADLAPFTTLERIYLPHNRDEAGWVATRRLAAQFDTRVYSIFLPHAIYQQPIKDVSDMAAKPHNPYLGAQLFHECGQGAVAYDPDLWAGAYN